MHSTVNISKERCKMPIFGQNRGPYFKKAARKKAEKKFFFRLISPTFYLVSKNVIFTTVRNKHWPKNGF